MSEIRARYIGVREFYAGVPARDLTAAEYEALPAEARRAVDEGGLYVVAEAVEQLPIEVWHLLAEAGLGSMDEVAAATDEALLAVPGIGPARLKLIREWLD